MFQKPPENPLYKRVDKRPLLPFIQKAFDELHKKWAEEIPPAIDIRKRTEEIRKKVEKKIMVLDKKTMEEHKAKLKRNLSAVKDLILERCNQEEYMDNLREEGERAFENIEVDCWEPNTLTGALKMDVINTNYARHPNGKLKNNVQCYIQFKLNQEVHNGKRRSRFTMTDVQAIHIPNTIHNFTPEEEKQALVESCIHGLLRDPFIKKHPKIGEYILAHKEEFGESLLSSGGYIFNNKGFYMAKNDRKRIVLGENIQFFIGLKSFPLICQIIVCVPKPDSTPEETRVEVDRIEIRRELLSEE